MLYNWIIECNEDFLDLESVFLLVKSLSFKMLKCLVFGCYVFFRFEKKIVVVNVKKWL